MGETTHEFRPPFGTAVVEDFCAITDEAHTELLQTLLALEMFNEVRVDVPVDDPLPLKLTDQRAAQIKGKSDWLWIRINDVPEALGARGYAADTDVVLEVTDPLGLAGGRFLLQIRDGVGKCAPHEGLPDIEIGLAELATIYMGAHRASELFRANRITELHSGALRKMDAAFSPEQAPYCGTLF
jgi:predicted acetyltransferase